jgi:hypothetical protein
LVVPHDNPDKLQTTPRNRKADRRLKFGRGGFRIAVGLRHFAFEFPFNQCATGTVLPGALAAWAMVRSSAR